MICLSHLFVQIERGCTYLTCNVNPQNLRDSIRSRNANICNAFHDRYSPLLLIVFSCSAIDLIAGNSLRRYVAAPSLKTIKAGRLCSF